jgi:serine O-acetyltransferase
LSSAVIAIYRVARWLHLRHVPLLPTALKIFNRIVFSVVLPPSAELGEGVLLSYGGLGTVIHARVRIGAHTVIATGVTIGGRSGIETVPIVGEGALIGTGAKVIGPVRIGNHASIGANAVVLDDVPDYGVAVGVPARVIRINRPDQLPDYFAFRQQR